MSLIDGSDVADRRPASDPEITATHMSRFGLEVVGRPKSYRFRTQKG